MDVLYVATRGDNRNSGQWGPVGRLERTASGYRFLYTQGTSSIPGFRPFPGMPDLERVYEAVDLFPLFSNRVLARTRPEFRAYLAWSGFSPDDPPEPMALLAVTEGRRATDSLEVFADPRPDEHGRYDTRFFLHRLRWMASEIVDHVGMLHPSENLTWRLEPDNPFDPEAVAVYANRVDASPLKIGYLPRYLARDFNSIQRAGNLYDLAIAVEHVNLEAPLQHRLLCRFNAGWPPEFVPSQRQAYQPRVHLASHPAD